MSQTAMKKEGRKKTEMKKAGMQQEKFGLLASIGMLLLFVIYTIMVANLDVQPIGPEGSAVGFASLNGMVAEAIGFQKFWYVLTDILGYVALLVVAFFGLLGLLQLIRGKSIQKVDADLLVLGGFYAVVFLCYVIFEVLVINYRPVMLEAGLEASYPSSHTMLAVCVFTTAIFQFQSRIRDAKICKMIEIVAVILIVLTVGGRLLSGAHWFTDIIGSLILSAALIFGYATAVVWLKGLRKRRRQG